MTDTNTARLVLATRPPGGIALYTFEVTCPLWVHVHLLTHKRPVRNRNSARYMAAKRYTAAYHTPPAFYRKSGKAMTGWRLATTLLIWHGTNRLTGAAARLLDRLDNEKEVANRVTTQAVAGKTVLTATDPAWRALLALRDHDTADRATHALASQIGRLIVTTEPREDIQHIPYAPQPGEGYVGDEIVKVATARIARVSNGRPRPGQSSDLDLYNRLISDGHMSPSEHIAAWVPSPCPSALCSKADDKNAAGFGWENLRSRLEDEV